MSAARQLVDRGVGAVLATLGAAGAVLVDDTGSWLATPPPIVPRSTVGAGDSALAGYLRADVGGADATAAAADGRRLRQRRRRAARLRAAHSRRRSTSTPFGVTSISPDHQPRQSEPNESIAMTSTASRPIIDPDLVLLDVDAGADKQAVIGRLAGRLADAGRATDADGLIAAAMAREEQSATGLPGGIAIPHCRSPHVDTAVHRVRAAATRRSTSARPTARPIWRS